jgi:flagellar protein FliO/FliZ
MRRIFLQCVVFLTLAFLHVVVWAADAPNAVVQKSATTSALTPVLSAGPSAITVIAGLFTVLALIFVLAFFLKRFNPAVLQKNSVLKVVASHSLGQRERIVVVAVGDQQLLLGVTSQHISLLHTLSEPLPVNEVGQSSFALQLQDVLMRRGS